MFLTTTRRLLLAVIFVVNICSLLPATAMDQAAQLEFFEKSIRPLLVSKCYECHSVKAKIKGGLRLDTKGGIEKGGDSGQI